MNLRKIINRRIRHAGDGIDVVGDVNAVISANVEERGRANHVSSKQRVVQRPGEGAVPERENERRGTGDPPHAH
jgi:hypothetical protein